MRTDTAINAPVNDCTCLPCRGKRLLRTVKGYPKEGFIIDAECQGF